MNVNGNEIPVSEQEETIDLMELFYKIVARWRWFLVSVPLCVGAMLFYCATREPVYNVTSKVMISDSKKGELGTSVMMKEMGFFQGDKYVENELVELQSKNLMRETVCDLELNIRYFEEGILRETELYKDSPVKVLVDKPGAIKDTCFTVAFSGDTAVVTAPDGEIIHEGRFSERIPLDGYAISVERNGESPSGEVRVYLHSYASATKDFYKKLEVAPLDKNTNALRLAVKDAVPSRGNDLIRALVDRYNENGVADKQVVSAKTVEFINARLEVINRELGTIEDDAERFKRTNKLTNIVADAEFVMERKKLAGTELLRLQTEFDVARSIRMLLEKREDTGFGLLPENLGISDEGVNGGISRYNEMVLRRNKLLLSAREDNPIVTGLDAQLREMRMSIREAVANVEKGLEIKINTLERENVSVDKRLTSVPTQEKQYRAIARQQELKENLFLFLMQKREEAEIAKLVYVPTAKIIEDPDAGDAPVSPRKAMLLLVGMVLGVVLPAGGVLARDMLDNKVRNVEDVERGIGVPLLGTFPEVVGEKLITREDFMQSESMHLVREKLNYMLKQQACPVVMVTSTIPGEGKSLIATHLSNAYAKTGKKVLLIGCDLRNPSLHNFVGQNRDKGLSAYLAGLADNVTELICPVDDHLDVLFGGAVPPNPVQLLADARVGELLEEMKLRYSCIILDTPPVGILAEGFALGKLSDACVYVVRADVLRKDALRIVAAINGEGRLPVMGILLNGVRAERGRGYGYGYYGYGYGYGYNREHDNK